jgi:hypothetical protein
MLFNIMLTVMTETLEDDVSKSQPLDHRQSLLDIFSNTPNNVGLPLM